MYTHVKFSMYWNPHLYICMTGERFGLTIQIAKQNCPKDSNKDTIALSSYRRKLCKLLQTPQRCQAGGGGERGGGD